jgi:predicted HicB family RNase H-like nuclease
MKPDSQKQIHIKMPYELHKELRVRAAVRETTIQKYVIQAINSQLAKDSKREKENV